MRRSIPSLLAVAAAGALAAPASADTVVAADPGAQSITAYGSTSAWSRKAADGTYRLVVRSGGTIAEAPVPPSQTPFDPDLGPTKDNRRVIVYARDGDIYQYVVGEAAEQRVAAISSARTEAAPSFFKGAIAFARTDGPRAGLYVYRPGRGSARIFRTVPAETDIAATRVVGRFGSGSRSIVRILNMTGEQRRIVARAGTEQRLASPFLSRFNAFWLRIGTASALVERVGVNAHRGLRVLRADRPLTGAATSVAGTALPELFVNEQGVLRVEPKLRFGG